MNKRISILIFFILIIFACTGPEKTIKPDETYKDDEDPIAISCIQGFIKNQEHVKPEFKMNNEMPELILYIQPSYMNLNSDAQEMVLVIIGTKWHECYGSDTRPFDSMGKGLTRINHYSRFCIKRFGVVT
jgi:hypothetical protein